MRAKITKRQIDSIQSGAKDVFLWDTDIRGFGLKVTPAGTKTYLFQYRMGGRGHPTRRYTIGPHGPLTPDEGRNMALELRAKIAKGIDPGRERAEGRAKALGGGPKTFGTLAEQFIHRECPRLARGVDIASVVRREIFPHWGDVPITDLRKRDAQALTDALVDADKPSAALKLYEVIKRIGNWFVERDELEVSPFANMKPPANKVVRDRALSSEEISCLWSACNQIGYPFGPLVQLLLLTGQRRNEVAGMRWSEIDIEAREWTIPGHRSKNGKPHLIPLSVPVLNILESMPRFDGPHVFTTTSGKRSVSGFSKAKAQIDRLTTQVLKNQGAIRGKKAEFDVDMEPWRFHDLRRTCRTGMAALGVPEIVCEKVLNHQPAILVKTYNVHAYESEKREALDLWANRVHQIVSKSPDNVVSIRARSPIGYGQKTWRKS